MKIKVLNDYRERQISFHAGQEIEMSDEEGERLLSDSPGSFKVISGGKPAGSKPQDAKTAPESASGDRKAELDKLGIDALKKIAEPLGVDTKVFGLSKGNLVSQILQAESGENTPFEQKAPAEPPANKMVDGAPEQKSASGDGGSGAG